MNIIPAYSPYGGSHNEPTMIVIHAMAEYVMMPDRTYLHAPEFLESMKLSAHRLIGSDGEVYKCRNDNEGAFHARGFNTDSLGVEVLLEGHHDYGSFVTGIGKSWVKPMQYYSIVEVCREWVSTHNINRIVRHSDLSPGRKVDPGHGFPWHQFLRDIGHVDE